MFHIIHRRRFALAMMACAWMVHAALGTEGGDVASPPPADRQETHVIHSSDVEQAGTHDAQRVERIAPLPGRRHFGSESLRRQFNAGEQRLRRDHRTLRGERNQRLTRHARWAERLRRDDGRCERDIRRPRERHLQQHRPALRERLLRGGGPKASERRSDPGAGPRRDPIVQRTAPPRP